MVPDIDTISRSGSAPPLHGLDITTKSAQSDVDCTRVQHFSPPPRLSAPPTALHAPSLPPPNPPPPPPPPDAPHPSSRPMASAQRPPLAHPRPPPTHRRPSDAPDRPKRIGINLASLAANALRTKEEVHTVRYIAQVDKDGWMVKRSKVGAKTNMFVVLEGTTLSFLKNKSGTPRYTINVRSDTVIIDTDRRELQAYIPNRERQIKLQIATQEESYLWKHALESAVNSDIADYYTFGDTLGSGAYGDVVQAFDVRTYEPRAVKIIQRGNNMKSREHLECEIQVMKSISHPNIVQTFQIFDLKRIIYIVMEYVPGGDLFDFVAQHESLTETQGSQTMRSIFQAVEYLHRHSIVHRDLKPENILCVNDSWPLQIKVTDFGFSNFIDPAKNDDNTMRTQVGTAYFMAPEIISNKGHGPAVDSWACGVILYTILTGRLPFPGKNTTEYFNNVLQGKPLFPAVLWKGISPDAMSLVRGLLNVDPNKRLTSLGALQHRWVATPDAYENEIRRDRSNLHSRRRRLFKARKAIIAVAMANKFKATIPQMVDGTKKVAEGIEKGVKKTADVIEGGVKKTADAIEGSVKKTADGIGEGVKKTASGIEKGVKKTADGIGGGVKKTASGVKKAGDSIGEGTKKVAEEIGEGTKKMASGIAEGSKKVAGGIGTSVKKTVDGVETGAKKVGEGVKKTADGFEKGMKKTADGFEKGMKKTADGLGSGVKKTVDGIEKGVKKTGDGIKRGVEKVKIDRDRSGGTDGTEGERSNANEETQSDSTRESNRRRGLFRRRGHESRSSATSASEISRHTEIPNPSSGKTASPSLGVLNDSKQSSAEYHSANEEQSEGEEGWSRESRREASKQDEFVAYVTEAKPSVGAYQFTVANETENYVGDTTDAGQKDSKHSSTGFHSAVEEHSENDDGWSKESQRDIVGAASLVTQPSTARTNTPMISDAERCGIDTFPDANRGALNPKPGSKHLSNNSNSSTGSTRPKLPLLSGLTMGLSDECMQGSSGREVAR